MSKPKAEQQPSDSGHIVVWGPKTSGLTNANPVTPIIPPAGVAPAAADLATLELIDAKTELARAVACAVETIHAELAAGKTTSSKTSQPNRKLRKPNAREKAILQACKDGLKGLRYCRFLDLQKIEPRHSWVIDLWPGSYVKAYKVPKLKRRIFDEKSKVWAKWNPKS
jgi:hypothetical protein